MRGSTHCVSGSAEGVAGLVVSSATASTGSQNTSSSSTCTAAAAAGASPPLDEHALTATKSPNPHGKKRRTPSPYHGRKGDLGRDPN
jgi:hypothetical protein